VAATLPPLRSTDGGDPLVLVKLFDPCSRWTWYLIECDPIDGVAFGFVVSGLGDDCDELGYVSIDELEDVRNRLGLPLERDLHWTPVKLSAVRNGEVR
jgi:hypothetical protein